MADTVFILGAGASRQGGAPLMGEFLDVAHDLQKQSDLGERATAFETVFEARSVFSRTHSKSRLDVRNMESLFTAFEMARTIGGFERYDASAADLLTAAMKTVIITTLEETMDFRISPRRVKPPRPYDSFAKLLVDAQQSQKRCRSIAVITFNYDVAADFALLDVGLTPDYGLSTTATGGVPLLKLHGSLHWAECPSCGNVVDVPLKDFINQQVEGRSLRGGKLEINNSEKTKHVRLTPLLCRYSHCGGDKVRPEPVIVPPTWNKAEYHRALQPVWSRAAQELREAERIFVIGFSLPPTDVFFNYLYALGATGDAVLERFWVFNPDTSVRDRFVSLLGPGAETVFQLYDIGFEEAIKLVQTELLGRDQATRRARVVEY